MALKGTLNTKLSNLLELSLVFSYHFIYTEVAKPNNFRNLSFSPCRKLILICFIVSV